MQIFPPFGLWVRNGFVLRQMKLVTLFLPVCVYMCAISEATLLIVKGFELNVSNILFISFLFVVYLQENSHGASSESLNEQVLI